MLLDIELPYKKKTILNYTNTLCESYHVLFVRVEYYWLGKIILSKKITEVHRGVFGGDVL
ncbi:hypothetical protein EMN47_04340 [Prolixibacteraceae bacterium JC049]|nr:hypothetical protein [Prolixibacteraceae bacterium JC049]